MTSNGTEDEVEASSEPLTTTDELPTTGISATAGIGTTAALDDSGTSTGIILLTSSSSGEPPLGSTTTGPMCPDAPEDGTYSECVNGFFCSGGGSCVSDNLDTFEVCSRGCLDVCNCWPTPEGKHTATVACRDDVLVDMSLTCVLDCSGGATCPDGMFCQDFLDICVYDLTATGTTGTGTGTGTAGG